MRIIVKDSYEAMSQACAEMIASQVVLKYNSILGFATGSTPTCTYEKLIEIFKSGRISFNEVTAFNLDEYIGLSPSNEQSYKAFMDTHLFNHIDILSENCHIPNGLAKDIVGECKSYEALIEKTGGIDLQLLGIGRNAHIGFNEPDVKFEAQTHLVQLDEDTIDANARFFDTIDEVPTTAISMGIKSIMMCKKVVLIASGSDKADAIDKMINGKITPNHPASILQLHQDVTVILDKLAASKLG